MIETSLLMKPINLYKIPIPSFLKLTNRDFNPIYISNLNEANYLFYKKCFPETFDYINSLKNLDFLTISKQGQKKIKQATEELHKMFINTTKDVLSNDNLYKYFNLTKKEWTSAKKSFEKSKNKFLYGRMDIGFSFDLKNIKLFEYNTGLCGDIFDTTDFQKDLFDYFFKCNPNKKKFNNLSEIENSSYSGSEIITKLSERFKYLIKSNNINPNIPIYFITDNGAEEFLVLSSIFKSITNANLQYKVCKFGNGLKYNKKTGNLIDEEYQIPVQFLYKTYSWYKILKELKKPNHKKYFDIFSLNSPKKFHFIEPMWKTIMGNKALLPFVYKKYPKNPLLLPSSFNPFDEIFENEDYLIEKAFTGRGSMKTKKVKKSEIKEKKNGVIYQKVFDGNKIGNDYYIMGSYIVGPKFAGCYVKQSNRLINEYSCNVMPVRFLEK